MKRVRLAVAALAACVLLIWEAEQAGAGRRVQEYWANSVIVGDSIAAGYQNYCMGSGEEDLESIKFLTAVSLSAHNSLWPVSEKSVHPVYRGEQRPVWESIAMTGAENVFLFLGMNDLNMGGDTCACYEELVEHIEEWSPGARIHIMSITYTYRGVEKGQVSNSNIEELNISLRELAVKNGWGFIDLTTPLSDGKGNLLDEYSSDEYVHQTKSAYSIWTDVLHQYIREEIEWQKVGGKNTALHVQKYVGITGGLSD